MPAPRTDLQEAMPRLIDEIRFFISYKQHVCISKSAGQDLLNIYQLPLMNIHDILSGAEFVQEPVAGSKFQQKHGVFPANVSLVMGVAGRH